MHLDDALGYEVLRKDWVEVTTASCASLDSECRAVRRGAEDVKHARGVDWLVGHLYHQLSAARHDPVVLVFCLRES